LQHILDNVKDVGYNGYVKQDFLGVLNNQSQSTLDTFQLFYEELASSTPAARIRRLRPAQ